MATEQTPLSTVADQDGAVVFDPQSGKLTTFNVTGAYVWAALQRGDDTAAIVSALTEDTGQASSVVEQGVLRFLSELRDHNLWPR